MRSEGMRDVRGVMWLAALLAAGFLLAAPAGAKTYTYKVKHRHTLGSCQGRLTVGENDVRYESEYRPDSRIWTYPQIKDIERPGHRRLTVFTYEDQRLQFGRDKPFEFEFLDGTVSDELYTFMVDHLGRAKNPRPPKTPPGGRYELAAKHSHFLGGCEGTLKITENFIEYVTSRSKDARLWKYMDIKSVESGSAYRLDIYTYEDQTLQFGRDKTFHFDLKEPLEPEVYEFILRHMNR